MTRSAPRFSAELLGRYRIAEMLGEGGTAWVFRAHQLALRRDVAIKVLKQVDAAMLARFDREAHILTEVRCPQVVQLFDFGRDGELAYLAFELIEGETLFVRHNREPLSLAASLHVIHEVSVALELAHGAGVVHRDVKPSNVFAPAGGHVKLSDFGIASSATSTTLTMPGEVFGTPATMAPEQVLGQVAGPPADVYSAGVMLYWLCTSHYPFEAEHAFAVARARVMGPAPRLRDRRPDLPPELDDLVARCLEQDPAPRPTATQLREQVAGLLEGLGAPIATRPAAASAPAGAGPDALPAATRALAASGERGSGPVPSGDRGGTRPGRRIRYDAAVRAAWAASVVSVALLGLLLWPRVPPGSHGGSAGPAAPPPSAAAGARVEAMLREARLAATLDPIGAAGPPRKRGPASAGLRELAARCRRDLAGLLDGAGALLDGDALTETERRAVYDGLSEVRVTERLLAGYGEPLLGAERALGSTLATGLDESDRARARVLGSAATGVLLDRSALLLPSHIDGMLDAASDSPAVARLEITSAPAPGERLVLEADVGPLGARDAIWLTAGGWRFLMHADCGLRDAARRPPAGKRNVFYHGIHASVVSKRSLDLRAEINALSCPGTASLVRHIDVVNLLAIPRR